MKTLTLYFDTMVQMEGLNIFRGQVEDEINMKIVDLECEIEDLEDEIEECEDEMREAQDEIDNINWEADDTCDDGSSWARNEYEEYQREYYRAAARRDKLKDMVRSKESELADLERQLKSL